MEMLNNVHMSQHTLEKSIAKLVGSLFSRQSNRNFVQLCTNMVRKISQNLPQKIAEFAHNFSSIEERKMCRVVPTYSAIF